MKKTIWHIYVQGLLSFVLGLALFAAMVMRYDVERTSTNIDLGRIALFIPFIIIMVILPALKGKWARIVLTVPLLGFVVVSAANPSSTACGVFFILTVYVALIIFSSNESEGSLSEREQLADIQRKRDNMNKYGF